MRLVRIKFSKLGESKYISHLDLMRCMSRAVRRAKLPLWYTEGFNPHPYMTFALPLSLGSESVCEFMDIRIEGDISNAEIMLKLNDVMPESIIITDIYEPVYDAKLITYAEFDVTFNDVDEAFASQLTALLSEGELIVKKISKKGRNKVMKEIDLREHIKNYVINTVDDKCVLTIVLPAGSTVNINPSLLVGLVKEQIADVYTDTLRKTLFTADMKIFK